MTNFFNCNKCDICFFNPIDLSVHLTNHKTLNLYRCFYCDYLSHDPINILNHIIDHSKTYTYKCVCNFVCKDSITFLNHQIAHRNVNPYKCFNCEYSCNEIENLKTHIDSLVCNSKDVKDNSVSKVKNCLKHSSQPKLKKRLRSYSRKFKCKYTECNYIAKRKYDLKRHTKSHEKNTVKKCYLNSDKEHKCNYSKCPRRLTN